MRFTTDDGYTLDGWLIPSGRETRATVVLMHGFSWHRLPWLTEFVPWIQPRFNILQFDFRGHGNSDDAPITLGTLEQRDVAAAVRFLQGRGYGPIGLMGISMGASVAIMAAPDLPVAAVVADAAYAVLENPIANRMREGRYPLPRLGARLVVAAASRPGADLAAAADSAGGPDRPARAAADRAAARIGWSTGRRRCACYAGRPRAEGADGGGRRRAQRRACRRWGGV